MPCSREYLLPFLTIFIPLCFKRFLPNLKIVEALEKTASKFFTDTHYGEKYLIRKKLSTTQAIAYASPMLGVNFFIGALTVLSGIYAKYFGLALSEIATAL